jgi:P-type Ca2+ transporter type 2C
MSGPGFDAAAQMHVETPWARPWQEVLDELDVSRSRGLSEPDAARRLARTGPNRLREPRRTSALNVLANQFRSVILLLLAAAAAVSFAFGDLMQAGAIVAVIAINAAVGFITEWRAVRSMEALRRMERGVTRVRRAGEIREIPAEELVPGDLVLLEGGDVVPADLRVIDSSRLEANESMLTGESLPVAKGPEPIGADVDVADRANILFKATPVTRGSGEGVVIATGMQTELGVIAALTEEAQERSTPLERRLEALGRRLVWVTLAVAAGVAIAGVIARRDLASMIEMSIALAVAAIPEGLPIVATLALARGMLRMARRKAIVQRLAAVETLGATTVICTDKTGTLTENRLSVAQLWLSGGLVDVGESGGKLVARYEGSHGATMTPMLREILSVGVLCNNATLRDDGSGVGDPLEVALLRSGAGAGVTRDVLLDRMPEVGKEAFDATTQMMATMHRLDESRYYGAVKGAPETVLRASISVRTDGGDRALDVTERQRWEQRVDELARRGFRVLAHADKIVVEADAPPYEGLRLLGLVGFVDPPRADAAIAIEACRRAGIHVVMVTGDQPMTALSIARAVHLVREEDVAVLRGQDIERLRDVPDALRAASIFARVTPKQKLDLVGAFQRDGQVVAMTGDGVNDAPALRQADIGVAMGRRGTQAAREAADMVLEDDSFSTIVAAVRQGRVIIQNIRRFVVYLLSCNTSEILLVASASVTSAPLPILPLQILFLNLVTDVFPALALGLGEGSEDVMTRAPRPANEQIVKRESWIAIAMWAGLITAAVLAAFWIALAHFGMDNEHAVTVSFLTLAFAQLWHVFNMRSRGSSLVRNDIVTNPWIWGALLICTGLLLAAVSFPPLARVLGIRAPGADGWLLIAALSLAPALLGPLLSRGLRRSGLE